MKPVAHQGAAVDEPHRASTGPWYDLAASSGASIEPPRRGGSERSAYRPPQDFFLQGDWRGPYGLLEDQENGLARHTAELYGRTLFGLDPDTLLV
jgi:hypothetical protein